MRKICFTILILVIVAIICPDVEAKGQFNSNGIFGVPVDDTSVWMRTFSEHNNVPRGVDLTVAYGTGIYSPFTGTLQYYRRSDIIEGSRQSVSYGNYCTITATINGVTYQFFMAHMSSFAGSYNNSLSDGKVIYSNSDSAKRSWTNCSKSTRWKEAIGEAHTVREGEYIGASGKCGYSSGDHCHIQIYVNGTNSDPNSYITNAFTAHSRMVEREEDPRYAAYVPLTGIKAKSSSKVTVYDYSGNAFSLDAHYIDGANDVCTIHHVYMDGFCEITYPTSKGSATFLARTSDFALPDPRPNIQIGSTMLSGFDRVLPDGDYMIAIAGTVDKSTYYYMDIRGGYSPAASGTDVALCGPYPSIPMDYDLWTIRYENGFYSIKQKGSDISLDVYGDGKQLYEGTNIWCTTYHGGDNQLWAISSVGDGTYRIQAKCSGFYADIAGKGISDGTNIEQCAWNPAVAQAWYFVPSGLNLGESFEAVIANREHGMVVTAQDDTNVTMHTFDGSDGQTWLFERQEDTSYKIVSKRIGMPLSHNSGRQNVEVEADADSDTQRWMIIGTGDDCYIMNFKGQRTLDVYAGGSEEGTNLWPCDYQSDNIHQKFRIIKGVLVSFNPGGGNCETKSKRVFDGFSYGELPVPTRNGWTFEGWFDGGTGVQSDTVVNAKSDFTLDGHWIYSPNSTIVPDGNYFLVPASDEEKMMTVNCSLIENGSNVCLNSGFDPISTFYLKRENSGYYRIYDINSGKPIEVNSQDYDSNNVHIWELNQGYWWPHLQLWVLEECGDGLYRIINQSGQCLTLHQNEHELGTNILTADYAGREGQKWRFIKAEHTISYDSSGGTGNPASQAKTYRNDIQLSSDIPKKEGYYFEGWSSTKGASEAEYLPGQTFNVDSDVLLYAVWLEPEILTPASLRVIEEEAFMEDRFTFVYLPDGVEAISERAFADCVDLRYIRIPATITDISETAFENVSDLTLIGKKNSFAEIYAKKTGFAFMEE